MYIIRCLFTVFVIKVEKYSDVKGIVIDSRYKAPAIAKQIIDDGKTPIMPYKRPMTKEGFFKKY